MLLVGITLGLCRLVMQLRRSSRTSTGIDQSCIHSELGIRHALYFTSHYSDWRDVLTSGVWLNNIQAGDATYTVKGIDPIDNDLSNNNEDPVILSCTASINDISRTLSVEAQNGLLSILKYAAASKKDMFFYDTPEINGDVYAGDDVHFSNPFVIIKGNVEASDKIYGSAEISGSKTQNASTLEFPQPSDVLDYYLPKATLIPYQQQIERKLISPTHNPYGPTNPDGLYKINCGGERIVIKECRIVGTLLIMNARHDSRIEQCINWEPARPDYPALIVNGDFEIVSQNIIKENSINADLSLSDEAGYGTETDTYPNLIRGLVYTVGKLQLSSQANIEGAVISHNDMMLHKNVQIKSGINWEYQPIKGFRSNQLAIVIGTWSQEMP